MLMQTMDKKSCIDLNQQITSSTSSQIKLLRRSSQSKSHKVNINRSQSQSSLQNSFPTYFIKKVPKLVSKNNEENLETTDVTPVKIQKKGGQDLKTEKKRMPTPSKSYRQIVQLNKTSRTMGVSELNLQRQMQIHQLQKKIASQNKIRMVYQQKAKQFQNQSAHQAKKAKLLEKQVQQIKDKQKVYRQRIQVLDKLLQSRNADLKSTKTNLQKLKQNIKQVRSQQFMSEIKKLKQEVERCRNLSQVQLNLSNAFKNENADLKMEVQRLKNLSERSKLKACEQSRASHLCREIQKLKNQLDSSKSQKQQFLEQNILQLQKQVEILKDINKTNTIHIDFLQRKRHQQIQNLRKKKGQQLNSLKMKFSVLMDEYKSLKHNKVQLRPKDVKSRQHQKRSVEKWQTQKRQNRFACPTRDHNEQDFVSFSLSPQIK